MKMIAGWAYPDLDDFMWREMKADGSYQGGHLRMAMESVKDFSLAIDGGAHVGTWSRLLSQRFERVIAVEPSPDTFEALAVNMATFGCHNVELKQRALGAEPGLVSMALEGRSIELSNTGARFVKDGGEIARETIDSWELPSCGFLKLDVEGSEALALQGAARTLKRCRPIVLFEYKGFCRRYGLPKDAVQQRLTRIRYRHVATAGTDEIWGPL